MSWQTNFVRKGNGFKEARRILEIGSGAFATSKALAEAYPDREFVGLDFVLSPAALDNLAEIPSNLTVVRHDARTLGLFADDYFDMVFSIAVMEHIHEIDQHLDEVHRIMRPGGRYWFWEVPFWSSSLGHHYRHTKPDCPVPPYSHLYATRDELAEMGVPEKALSRIYDRGDLSRLSRTRTRELCEASNFTIEKWNDEPDDNYSAELVTKVLDRNLFNVSEEDLQFKGAKVSLVAGANAPGDAPAPASKAQRLRSLARRA